MNGLPLLLLASTVGMDFGWQPAVDNPNMLEYIIQLSPEEVQLLNSGKEELFSGIPQELKGRIDRVVIRMGREKLPQEPSLEKLRTMAAVGGNPSILNAGGSAAGTSLGAPPTLGNAPPLGAQGGLATIDPPRTLPSFGSGSPAPAPPITYSGNYDALASGAFEDLLRRGTMPPNTLAPSNSTSIVERMSDNGGIPAVPVNQTGAGGAGSTLPTDPRSSFAGGGFSGGNAPTTPPSNSNIFPREGAGTGFVGASGANTPAAANNPILPAGNGQGTTLPAGGWGSTAANPPRGTNTGAPVGFNNNSVAGNSLGNNPSLLAQGNGGNFGNPPVTMASNQGNFGGAPANYPPTGSNMGTGNLGNGNTGGFVASGNGGNSGRLPSGGGSNFSTSPTLVASSNPSGSLGASSSFEDEDVSPSEKTEAGDETETSISASNWEKVLQILFILSVVLNFYLGVHLHKLLLRYRTLLSSVRASATVA